MKFQIFAALALSTVGTLAAPSGYYDKKQKECEKKGWYW